MTPELDTLVAKDQIIDTLNRLFVSTDAREWTAVAECFADDVLFDMTSLAGGSPTHQTPGQIIAAWEEGLRPLDAVHHQVGNFRVEPNGADATAFCYGIATHYRKTASGRNTRTFVGSYDFRLVKDAGRWRVNLFRFNLKYLDGNLELENG